MDITHIMLSEVRQEITVWYHLYVESKNVKPIEKEKRKNNNQSKTMITRELGMGVRLMVFKGTTL